MYICNTARILANRKDIRNTVDMGKLVDTRSEETGVIEIWRSKMREQLTKELLAFEADHTWVNENLEALLAQYADQWIAVKNGQVIASDSDLAGLLSKLPDPAYTCVEFITREPLEMVL